MTDEEFEAMRAQVRVSANDPKAMLMHEMLFDALDDAFGVQGFAVVPGGVELTVESADDVLYIVTLKKKPV